MDPESLYLQLQQLVQEMPVLGGAGAITPDVNRWLGRAAHLVEAAEAGRLGMDAISIRSASDGLASVIRDSNAQHIYAAVYRALARAEANAPASARGAFIAVGAAFDVLQAVQKVLAEAKSDVLILDPYMDAKVLTDFAPLAAEGVNVRLLTDAFYTKPETMRPAAERWVQQFGSVRPLDTRISEPRALHDRLILLDGTTGWNLSQSLKDFAGRSPASVIRLPPDIAKMKIEFYAQVWDRATKIP